MDLSTQDRLDIAELLYKADTAATRRDAAGYAGLFVEDGVIDGTQGVYQGRSEIVRSVGPIWEHEGPATAHLTLNPVITAGADADHAVADSVLLIVTPGEAPKAPGAVLGVAAIVQRVVRTPTGWRIARRTVGAISPHNS